MVEFEYELKDPAGFHARPATKMVQEASKFRCEIKIKCDGKEASGKRIFAILGLGAKEGDKVTFVFDGPDEKEALEVVRKFVEANM